MVEVIRVPLSQDLSGFTAILWQHKIPHRVLEQDDEQLVLVPHNVNAEQIAQLFDMWQQGVDLSGLKVRQSSVNTSASIKSIWLTLLLIGLSAGVTLLIALGENIQMMRWFTLVDFRVQGQQVFFPSLLDSFKSGQVWRLVTPAFMHFNFPHIIFNLLWVWVAGRRIEMMLGWPSLLALFIVSAVASNLAQFWVSGPMFGGMSGFVFALLGFAWLWDRRNSSVKIGLPPALMGFMLFWLALGFTGVLESVGMGAIANTAHLIGLISGLLLVPLVGLVRRR